ncbi:hypothetical protein SD80_012355 [Scytonema tolypothrichoides VB-61278]|nr:hypothetical protein SD80_012355 [Scytonema tolypothrichoides VB-61278]
MNNSRIEERIFSACNSSVSAREFTDEEKRYILEHQKFREDMLRWFESNSSDGCWTEEAVNFMRCFYDYWEVLRLIINLYGISPEDAQMLLGENVLDPALNLSLLSQRQIATMLAALRLFQQQLITTNMVEMFPEHFDYGNILPLSPVEIDHLCEQINVSQEIETDEC